MFNPVKKPTKAVKNHVVKHRAKYAGATALAVGIHTGRVATMWEIAFKDIDAFNTLYPAKS